MIVQLTGRLTEVQPSFVVLDVGGVGYEMGVSANTAAALPEVGTEQVSLFTRMVVREGAVDLFGFGTRDERALFDRLVGISKVGPKLALSVLSTFTPAALAAVVGSQDAKRMATVPGVGQKTASRLLMELVDIFAKDPTLRSLSAPVGDAPGDVRPVVAGGVDADVTEALLSMGFTPQEAELAIEGREAAGAVTVEAALGYALKRLGGRS